MAYETLAEAAEATQRFATQLSEARAELESFRFTSADGMYTIELDSSGDPTGIQVSSSWRRSAAPEEVGQGIVMALTSARAEQAGRWLQAVSDAGVFDSRPPLRPHQPEFEWVRTEPGPGGDSPIDEALYAVGGVEGATGELQNELVAALRRRFESKSHDDTVSVAVSGQKEVLQISIASAWMDSTDPSNVGRKVLDALNSAYASIPSDLVSSIIANSRLGRAKVS